MNKSGGTTDLRNLSADQLKTVLEVGQSLPMNISFGAKSHGLPRKLKKLTTPKLSLNSKSIRKKSVKKISTINSYREQRKKKNDTKQWVSKTMDEILEIEEKQSLSPSWNKMLQKEGQELHIEPAKMEFKLETPCWAEPSKEKTPVKKVVIKVTPKKSKRLEN